MLTFPWSSCVQGTIFLSSRKSRLLSLSFRQTQLFSYFVFQADQTGNSILCLLGRAGWHFHLPSFRQTANSWPASGLAVAWSVTWPAWRSASSRVTLVTWFQLRVYVLDVDKWCCGETWFVTSKAAIRIWLCPQWRLGERKREREWEREAGQTERGR